MNSEGKPQLKKYKPHDEAISLINFLAINFQLQYLLAPSILSTFYPYQLTAQKYKGICSLYNYLMQVYSSHKVIKTNLLLFWYFRIVSIYIEFSQNTCRTIRQLIGFKLFFDFIQFANTIFRCHNRIVYV